MENKKVALIFLYFIGAIQLVAGVYTQLVGLFHWDFMSLFPVVEMGTQQILYLNLLAVFLVTTLIHIVVAALVNDGSYGPFDVLRACPPLTVVVPLVLFGISIYTTLGATSVGSGCSAWLCPLCIFLPAISAWAALPLCGIWKIKQENRQKRTSVCQTQRSFFMLYLPRKSTNSSATTAIPPKAAKILTAREIASYTLVGMIWKKAKCSGSCSFLPTKSR